MPHGTTATFNQYVKYFFPLANQFGKKEDPTSEQCYQPLPFNTGRVLLDCLLPNSTSAEQLPTFHPGDKVWSGEFASIFWLTPRPKETAQNTLHLRAPEVPISVQHGTGAGRGWLLHDFQTKFSLWGRGATALAQLSSWNSLPFRKALPKLCMIQTSRTARISDQIVHKVPAAAWKVTPAIKCWETFFF